MRLSLSPSEPHRVGSDRAQSHLVGIVLLLAIIGTVIVLTAGSIAFQEDRRASQIKAVEHSMTQFDSNAAVVTLGQSQPQTLRLIEA